MAHTLQVDYKDLAAFTNDPHFHEDEEFHIFQMLDMYWDSTKTQDKRPQFFLTEKIITHDLAESPAIVIYNSEENSHGIGLTYPAKTETKTLVVDIKSLDRGLLFDTRKEVVRILDYCRKYPIPRWDFITTLTLKRIDPRAGNNHTMVFIRLRKLVHYIPAVVFPHQEFMRQPGIKVEITTPTPSLLVDTIMNIDAIITSTEALSNVEAYIDGIQIGAPTTSTTPSWTYDTSSLTNTAHLLYIKAFDVDEKIGTSAVLFRVNN